MLCPKCKIENSDNAKFCKSCGTPLAKKTIDHKSVIESVSSNNSSNSDNKKMIMAILAIVVIVLAGTFVYSSGILSQDNNPNSVEVPLSNSNRSVEVPVRNSENSQTTTQSTKIELKTQNFGDVIKMSVPKSSNFIEDGSDMSIVFYSYRNTGDYSYDAYALMFCPIKPDMSDNFNFIKVDGDVKVYTYKDNSKFYVVEKSIDGCYFSLMGDNLDLLEKMINSIEVTNKDALSYSTSSYYDTSSNLPLSILGGSISTGSGLSDKTEASIYVGSNHAGEKVTIQIYYSRDGNSLNSGNMVQKTVDSSGYIHVNSADSYKYYPDSAIINIYDSNGNMQDSVTVSLTPNSGKQTF